MPFFLTADAATEKYGKYECGNAMHGKKEFTVILYYPLIEMFKATPHNSARANYEKIWVLMKAVFRRNTLCISRKSDKIRAQIFQKAPKTDCAVLP